MAVKVFSEKSKTELLRLLTKSTQLCEPKLFNLIKMSVCSYKRGIYYSCPLNQKHLLEVVSPSLEILNGKYNPICTEIVI